MYNTLADLHGPPRGCLILSEDSCVFSVAAPLTFKGLQHAIVVFQKIPREALEIFWCVKNRSIAYDRNCSKEQNTTQYDKRAGKTDLTAICSVIKSDKDSEPFIDSDESVELKNIQETPPSSEECLSKTLHNRKINFFNCQKNEINYLNQVFNKTKSQVFVFSCSDEMAQEEWSSAFQKALHFAKDNDADDKLRELLYYTRFIRRENDLLRMLLSSTPNAVNSELYTSAYPTSMTDTRHQMFLKKKHSKGALEHSSVERFAPLKDNYEEYELFTPRGEKMGQKYEKHDNRQLSIHKETHCDNIRVTNDPSVHHSNGSIQTNSNYTVPKPNKTEQQQKNYVNQSEDRGSIPSPYCLQEQPKNNLTHTERFHKEPQERRTGAQRSSSTISDESVGLNIIKHLYTSPIMFSGNTKF